MIFEITDVVIIVVIILLGKTKAKNEGMQNKLGHKTFYVLKKYSNSYILYNYIMNTAMQLLKK